MGINSVGHRLTILKSVYDVKKAQDVPVEPDHYMPLSTFVPIKDGLAVWSGPARSARASPGPAGQAMFKRQ